MKQKSGIDIDLGNRCSKIAYSYAKRSFVNRNNKIGKPITSIDGSFANCLQFNNLKIGISSDGIGTKIELAERSEKYETLGYDLVAMVADDLAANGFDAANLSNILDVNFLDEKIIDSLMQGLSRAAKEAGIAVTGGEIAELGNRISGYGNKMNFNWTATAIGVLPAKLDKPIAGKEIRAGDVIIGLKSRGFRSNGFSLIRNIMESHFGAEWHEKKFDEKYSWCEKLLEPCLIYAGLINQIIESDFPLRGLAHITGGGLPDNISRILKSKNLGAKLDDIWEPFPIMVKLQQLGEIEEKKCYKIWNMGTGMVMFVASQTADSLLKFLESTNFKAKVCGKVIDKPYLKINSKGNKPQELIYAVE